MLYIYPKILFPGQLEVSHIPFIGLHFFDATFVITVSLDARLVKHIRHQLMTGHVSHLVRHSHHFLLAFVEILHINTNKAIISRMFS